MIVVASVTLLVVGYLAPAPPLLIAALGAVLTITWLLAVRIFIQGDAWPPNELEALEGAANDG